MLRWIEHEGHKAAARRRLWRALRVPAIVLLVFFAQMALWACAGSQRVLAHVDDAVHRARQGLHAVKLAADISADQWARQVDARIESCRDKDLPTPKLRAACMGVFGQGDAFEADVAAFRDAYDETAEAMLRLEQAARRLEARSRGEPQGERNDE